MQAAAVVIRNERSRILVDYLGEAVPCAHRRPGRVLVRPTLAPGVEVVIERLPDSTYAVVGVDSRRSAPLPLAG